MFIKQCYSIVWCVEKLKKIKKPKVGKTKEGRIILSSKGSKNKTQKGCLVFFLQCLGNLNLFVDTLKKPKKNQL